MTVGPGAQDFEGGVEGGQRHAALEESAQALNEMIGPLGEVGECPFADSSVVSVGLAQEHGGWRVAVGYAFDVHGFSCSFIMSPCLPYLTMLHGYTVRPENRKTLGAATIRDTQAPRTSD